MVIAILLFDVSFYLSFVETNGGNEIADAPEIAVDVNTIEKFEMMTKMSAGVGFHLLDNARYRFLGWYFHEHVDMIVTSVNSMEIPIGVLFG
jgi:hypothetical protein